LRWHYGSGLPPRVACDRLFLSNFNGEERGPGPYSMMRMRQLA